MTEEEKKEFQKIIDDEIVSLSAEIDTIKKALYPERGEGPADKVAHLNLNPNFALEINNL